MDNRVYYGEYSLKHWIDLVLKGNIILPDYQRYFVWNEKKVETLIETFKNKQFVPPVTIGAFKMDRTTNQNLILDGQQRITSILLAYIGLYPKISKYKPKDAEVYANDNDEIDEESLLDDVLEWNLKKLTEQGNNRDTIRNKVLPTKTYQEINFNIDEAFFETNFLGFSYLVPDNANENEQQKYYSSVFRNINIQGEALLPQESRASLYFLDHQLAQLFSPKFFSKIIITLIGNQTKADFVRYLSILSQYHKSGATNKIARGYKQKMEKFYEEYIYASINNTNLEVYGEFLSIFPDKVYKDDLNNLENTLHGLDLFNRKYTSIIDVDVCLFGLIYQIMFKKKKIDILRKEELNNQLSTKIKEFRDDTSHSKSPNNLTYLRNRIEQSIVIYEEYIIHES